jgi:hypothetical protein
MLFFLVVKRAAEFVFGERFQRALVLVGCWVGEHLCLDDLLLFERGVELLLELQDSGFFGRTLRGFA